MEGNFRSALLNAQGSDMEGRVSRARADACTTWRARRWMNSFHFPSIHLHASDEMVGNQSNQRKRGKHHRASEGYGESRDDS